MPDALRTRGLSRRLGRHFAIRDVSMSVPAGAIYGLLGPNGAGKTTTLRLLLDLARPDSGAVEILGVDARRYPGEARRRVGYVPESAGMPGWMTVSRLMRHHATFHPSWSTAYAEELRVRMRIPSERPVRHLSKGQAGKLALLLALAHRPGLLVLDEPTDGLDPVARRDFHELLMEYVAESGAAVLVSSHIVNELERMADWVAVMDDGELVAEMPLDGFRRHIKRLRVVPPAGMDTRSLPFSLLSRVRRTREELWAVQGWEPAMAPMLGSHAVQLREVVDLDLEECYVELLRSRTEARDAS